MIQSKLHERSDCKIVMHGLFHDNFMLGRNPGGGGAIDLLR